jgi:U1 small nuclear ribonucleoprotein
MWQYGPVKNVTLVYDTQTQKPRGYGFVEFEHERDMKTAYKHADGRKIDGRRVLVDVERGRTVKDWKPRRLGHGLGSSRKDRPKQTKEEKKEKKRQDALKARAAARAAREAAERAALPPPQAPVPVSSSRGYDDKGSSRRGDDYRSADRGSSRDYRDRGRGDDRGGDRQRDSGDYRGSSRGDDRGRSRYDDYSSRY